MLRSLALALALVLAFAAPARADEVTISAQGFHDYLAATGHWVTDVPGVGEAWHPNPFIVGNDFRPYATRGHWEWTEAGWSFESDFAWGWATFHYGQWTFDEAFGWVWVPGTTWAPAWVEWRVGGEVVGWAPRRPEALEDVPLAEGAWTFVATADFLRRDAPERALPSTHIAELLSRTESLRAGPSADVVGAATGSALEPRPVAPIAQAQVNPASRPKPSDRDPIVARAESKPVKTPPAPPRAPEKKPSRTPRKPTGITRSVGPIVIPASAPPPARQPSATVRTPERRGQR